MNRPLTAAYLLLLIIGASATQAAAAAFASPGSRLLLGPSSSTADDAPVLARVDLPTGKTLADLHIPVHAHLADASGQQYVLTIAAPSVLTAALGSPPAYLVIDRDVSSSQRYILAHADAKDSLQRARAARVPILYENGETAVLRASDVGKRRSDLLHALHFDLQQLLPRPMALTPAAAAGDDDDHEQQQQQQHSPAVQSSGASARITGGVSPSSSSINATTLKVVKTIVDRVTATDLMATIGGVVGKVKVSVGGHRYKLHTRHTASSMIKTATQYLYEQLSGLGLSNVGYHAWSSGGYTGRNVYADIVGTATPSKLVLMTAHADNRPGPSGHAQGADDNASGVTAVLTAARLLRNYTFDSTIRFVLFTGEEQGLLGSEAYAADLSAASADVVGVVNSDMIGWNTPRSQPVLGLHIRRTSNPAGYAGDLRIAQAYIDVVNGCGLRQGVVPEIRPDGDGASDHSSFWSFGWPAVMLNEDWYNDHTPHYHKRSDKVGTLNKDYFTACTQGAIGTVAVMAGNPKAS